MKKLVFSVLELWAEQHQAELFEAESGKESSSWRMIPKTPNNGDMVISWQEHPKASPSPHPLDVVIANELGWVESFSCSFDDLEATLDNGLKILQSDSWQVEPTL